MFKFVVLYIMHVFVVSKRILNHLAGFCSIIFANMYIHYQKNKPRKFKLQHHECK